MLALEYSIPVISFAEGKINTRLNQHFKSWIGSNFWDNTGEGILLIVNNLEIIYSKQLLNYWVFHNSFILCTNLLFIYSQGVILLVGVRIYATLIFGAQLLLSI